MLLTPRAELTQVLSSCTIGGNATKGELSKAEEFGTVIDLVPSNPRVSPAGRLDFDSEGLIVLTNDGSLIKLLTSPQYQMPKTYLVRLSSSSPS